MKYILITSKGQRAFHLRACAEVFQKICGGEIREVDDHQAVVV